MNPVTKDVQRKFGVEAVKRSIRNLVLTNFYERPFQESVIGSNVTKLLFENITSSTARLISQNIEDCINNWEPRAQLQQVIVSVPNDQNSIQADIVFTMKNLPAPQTVTVFLQRVR